MNELLNKKPHKNSIRKRASCVGKKKFDTYNQAKANLTENLARSGGRMLIYKCCYCDGYHIGAAQKKRRKDDLSSEKDWLRSLYDPELSY